MKWKKEKSRTGLLFASIKAYEERIWNAAFKQARERGLSYDEAKRHADDALRYAKEEAKRSNFPNIPSRKDGISEDGNNR